MPSPRTADEIFAELRDRRVCGVVHAGVVAASDLPTVAAAFGLAPDVATYRAIDPEEARRVLIRTLHRDLAYDAEIMPMVDARRLASEVLRVMPDGQLWTNGSYGSPATVLTNRVTVGPSWNPATSATFDAGVIVVGSVLSACVWVEDED
ncbi:MAG: hypothetical protein AB7S26_08370 [Sandaracinaceae bacterium]